MSNYMEFKRGFLKMTLWWWWETWIPRWSGMLWGGVDMVTVTTTNKGLYTSANYAALPAASLGSRWSFTGPSKRSVGFRLPAIPRSRKIHPRILMTPGPPSKVPSFLVQVKLLTTSPKDATIPSCLWKLEGGSVNVGKFVFCWWVQKLVSSMHWSSVIMANYECAPLRKEILHWSGEQKLPQIARISLPYIAP